MIRSLFPFGAILALTFAAGILLERSNAATREPQPEWTVAATLERPRTFAKAVALATGEILVVGGMDTTSERVTVPTTELFDPASGRITTLAQPIVGRLNQSVTVGWGDRVVVAGGTEWLAGIWRSSSRTDVYLPWSRTWLRAANMIQPRSDHGAAALADGRVLVVAGNYNAQILRSSEIYDPELDYWLPVAPLPAGRTQFSLATLPDGRVLAAGGFETDGKMVRTTWIYEPWNDEWVKGPEMREVRLNHSMVRLPGGDLLFFGGEQMGAGTAERYRWRERRFEYAGVLGQPRLVAQGAVLANGAVIAVGGLPEDRGRHRFTPTIDAEIWDPQQRIWLDLIDPPTSRAYAQLVVTGAAVYRISGIGEDESAIPTIEALTWH